VEGAGIEDENVERFLQLYEQLVRAGGGAAAAAAALLPTLAHRPRHCRIAGAGAGPRRAGAAPVARRPPRRGAGRAAPRPAVGTHVGGHRRGRVRRRGRRRRPAASSLFPGRLLRSFPWLAPPAPPPARAPN